MGPAWLEKLHGALQQKSFLKLKAFLGAEKRGGKTIYPPEKDVYTWSRQPAAGPAGVRVVIVGQDPYHGPGQACGLSFSVGPGVPVPPSLRNIYKEIANEFPPRVGGAQAGGTTTGRFSGGSRPDLLLEEGFVPPQHGSLIGWAQQGVLLLNACLVR